MEHYSEREGRQLEFKERLGGYAPVIRTVVAFSNDVGGRIVIGVRDSDRAIIGVSDQDLERYLEELPRAIYDAITPSCRPLIAPKQAGLKKILEVEVFPGGHKPYYVTSQGMEKGTYVRVGSHTKRASEDIRRELIRERERRFFDEEILPSVELSSLDSTSLKTFYDVFPVSTELLLADRVVGVDPVTRTLHPTVAGILFFHPQPAAVLPGAELLFSRLEGVDLSEVLSTLDLTGSLPTIANRVIAELRPFLSTKQSRKGAKLLVTEQEIPEPAIREALLNALIHRKYTIADAVKVALFQDRLEIFSPGNFPGPITDLLSGVSYTRNPALRHLARKAGLVEKRGWGFSLIFSECERNGNPRPQIVEGGDFVKVTLFRTRLGRGASAPVSRATVSEIPPHLVVLRECLSPAFQTRHVMEVLRCSENTARARIKELLDEGLVTPEGRGRSRQYRWTR